MPPYVIRDRVSLPRSASSTRQFGRWPPDCTYIIEEFLSWGLIKAAWPILSGQGLVTPVSVAQYLSDWLKHGRVFCWSEKGGMERGRNGSAVLDADVAVGVYVRSLFKRLSGLCRLCGLECGAYFGISRNVYSNPAAMCSCFFEVRLRYYFKTTPFLLLIRNRFLESC